MQNNIALIYDTHIHSTFSHDGKSTIEEYAEIMEEKNVKGIGFTEHLDYLPDASGYGLFRYDLYSDSIKGYRERGYEFYKGIELGYGVHVEKEILEGIRDKSFDYVIGAVHRLDGQSMSTKRFHEFIEAGGDYLTLIEHYYQSVSSSIKFKPYDVIAHIGVYKDFLTESSRNSQKLIDLVNDAENELVRECAISNKIIEVNTSKLFSALGDIVPGRRFLESFYRKGGRFISLASDAHSAQNLARGFNVAIEMLKSIGYKYLTLPWDKEHPIRI